MSKNTHLKGFLKALDDVKNDFVCKVCMELVKNPVTFDKCFHTVCRDHIEGLKTCPECNRSLEGCGTFSDTSLEPSIESFKELEEIFKPFAGRYSAVNLSGSSVEKNPVKKRRTASKDSANLSKQDSSLDFNLDGIDNKAEKENVQKTHATKTKPQASNKANTSQLSVKYNNGVEKQNAKGETALHISCRLGKIDKVQELINEGAMTNTKDYAGWTPLHEAVQNAHLDLVKLLLQHNALINVPGQSNETPLHEAVRYTQTDEPEAIKYTRIKIIKELVKNGADLNARNCKGETPLQLATPDIKEVLITASENLIQTQSVNLTFMSERHYQLDSDDFRVYCVSRNKTVQAKLKTLTKYHCNIQMVSRLTNKVTCLIVDTQNDLIASSSFELLQGIIYNMWILSTQWVTDSTDEKLAKFESYEVKGVNSPDYNGPKVARYNKYKQFPGLFDGCHFYLHNFTQSKYEISKTLVVNKQNLSKLIIDGGGVVLRRVPNPESIPDTEKLVPYHANRDGKLANCSHYIIYKDVYEPMYNMSHLKALPIGWLIECIEKYELVEPEYFTM